MNEFVDFQCPDGHAKPSESLRLKRYWVNTRQLANGDHEVHEDECQYTPSSRKYLGWHPHCGGALVQARKTYPTANGCKRCCPSCRTRENTA